MSDNAAPPGQQRSYRRWIMPQQYEWFRKMDNARAALAANGLISETVNCEIKRRMKKKLNGGEA